MESRIHGTMRGERERRSERGREERGRHTKTKRGKRINHIAKMVSDRKGKLGKRGPAWELEMFRVGVGVRSSKRSPDF